MMIKYLILICTFFLYACDNKQKLSKGLTQLQSKSIMLPVKSITILESREISIIDSIDSKLKLIIYNDSIGCTSCAINKMYLWDNFIEYANLYNGRLKYYYIYSPSKKDIHNVTLALKNNIFNYPVFLDTLGEFERLNPHLPKNKIFHTFLLDEKNNVVLVGNPLHNKKVEEMFYKIVEEKLGKPH